MPTSAPKINTYHCHCTTLLLSSTHTLSTLPHRASPSNEIILPLPSPPSASQLSNPSNSLPKAGYSTLHALSLDSRTIIRKEDGFEKRVLYRCERCRLVVGYEVLSSSRNEKEQEGEEMDIDGESEEEGNYKGKVIYLLQGGLVSTEFMAGIGKEGRRKIREEDVEIGKGGVVVFE